MGTNDTVGDAVGSVGATVVGFVGLAVVFVGEEVTGLVVGEEVTGDFVGSFVGDFEGAFVVGD